MAPAPRSRQGTVGACAAVSKQLQRGGRRMGSRPCCVCTAPLPSGSAEAYSCSTPRYSSPIAAPTASMIESTAPTSWKCTSSVRCRAPWPPSSPAPQRRPAQAPPAAKGWTRLSCGCQCMAVVRVPHADVDLVGSSAPLAHLLTVISVGLSRLSRRQLRARSGVPAVGRHPVARSRNMSPLGCPENSRRQFPLYKNLVHAAGAVAFPGPPPRMCPVLPGAATQASSRQAPDLIRR